MLSLSPISALYTLCAHRSLLSLSLSHRSLFSFSLTDQLPTFPSLLSLTEISLPNPKSLPSLQLWLRRGRRLCLESLEIVVELVVELEIVTLDAYLEMKDGFRSQEMEFMVFALICLDGTLPDYQLYLGFGSQANSWLIQLETFTIGIGSSFAIAMVHPSVGMAKMRIDVSGNRTMRNLYVGVVKLQLQESLAPRAADPNNDWHECKLNHAWCKVSPIQFLQERGPMSRFRGYGELEMD
ncbi:hypothetical protein Syun_014213 [Stephania yunnanensis]|uniref:Uncharacterized protein n=1 Tax=Stephania yunnanensis TaxID=152371 RepID=A0AAP0JKK8_9MAGN